MSALASVREKAQQLDEGVVDLTAEEMSCCDGGIVMSSQLMTDLT